MTFEVKCNPSLNFKYKVPSNKDSVSPILIPDEKPMVSISEVIFKDIKENSNPNGNVMESQQTVIAGK